MTTDQNGRRSSTPAPELRWVPESMPRDKASFLVAATLFVFVVVIPLVSRIPH
jgi:hypothetical protein